MEKPNPKTQESPSSITRVKNAIPSWVKSIALLLITGVICIKVYETPVTLQFDFPSFLSLLLALFSVALAALFYFKATDTSNAFYDNTYKFSQDVASLLAKIESGFGERLRHLDETYKGMKDSFDRLPNRFNVQEAKKDLEEEEVEVENIKKDRERLIQELVAKTQLRQEEKEEFLNRLKDKESSLESAQQEILNLKRRVVKAERRQVVSKESIEMSDPAMHGFTVENVIPQLGKEDFKPPSGRLRKAFRDLLEKLPRGYFSDLERFGLIDSDGDLTRAGVWYLRETYQNSDPSNGE